MKIFKSATLCWWQVGILKLAMLFLGIVIGVYWQEIFVNYFDWLWIFGLILMVYIAVVWIKQ